MQRENRILLGEMMMGEKGFRESGKMERRAGAITMVAITIAVRVLRAILSRRNTCIHKYNTKNVCGISMYVCMYVHCIYIYSSYFNLGHRNTENVCMCVCMYIYSSCLSVGQSQHRERMYVCIYACIYSSMYACTYIARVYRLGDHDTYFVG